MKIESPEQREIRLLREGISTFLYRNRQKKICPGFREEINSAEILTPDQEAAFQRAFDLKS